MNIADFNEVMELRAKLETNRATSECLISDLDTLVAKDADLNRKLVIAKSNGQNLRPIY